MLKRETEDLKSSFKKEWNIQRENTSAGEGSFTHRVCQIPGTQTMKLFIMCMIKTHCVLRSNKKFGNFLSKSLGHFSKDWRCAESGRTLAGISYPHMFRKKGGAAWWLGGAGGDAGVGGRGTEKVGSTWLPAWPEDLQKAWHYDPAPPAAASWERVAPAELPLWCRWPPPLLSGGLTESVATRLSPPKYINRWISAGWGTSLHLTNKKSNTAWDIQINHQRFTEPPVNSPKL